jgi:hypothetical protein
MPFCWGHAIFQGMFHFAGGMPFCWGACHFAGGALLLGTFYFAGGALLLEACRFAGGTCHFAGGIPFYWGYSILLETHLASGVHASLQLISGPKHAVSHWCTHQ